MLAHLEAVKVVAIKRLVSDPEEAVALLGDGAAQVKAEQQRLRTQQLDLSPLDVTTLAQKGAILAKLGVLPDSEEAVRQDFSRIYERLRNPVMHVGDYVSDSLTELRAFLADLNLVTRPTDEIYHALAS
jgi:hypothetical protein